MPWIAASGSPRSWGCLAGSVAFVAAGFAGPSIDARAASEVSADGLIVQLKDASSSDEAAQPQRAAPVGMTVPDRMQRVLKQAGIGAAVRRRVGRSAELLDFGRRLTAQEATTLAERLRARPDVAWVVPNEREHRLQVPTDPLFPASASSPGQWWLFPAGGSNANVLKDRLRGVPDIQSAWAIQTGSPGVVIAVLDTGIASHPDLDPQVLPGYDFVSSVDVANDGNGRDPDPSDPGDWVSDADKAGNHGVFADCAVENSSWHGTIIAGILAASVNNGIGVAAASWNGRVLPVRVAGKCGADVADIVDGMRWAAGLTVAGAPPNPNPARVINISFGGSAACNAVYQSTIDELAAAGAVVVAAAGNERTRPSRPASCLGVVGVAALNRDGFKASYSNFGPELAIATVGGDAASQGTWGQILGDDGILTLSNAGAQSPAAPVYSRVFGSSFAAPIAAGTIGLMLSVNPALTVPEIINGLRASARPHVASPKIPTCSTNDPGRCICTQATCGAGILDAVQALLYAADPTAYVAPVRQAAVLDNADVNAAIALGPDVPPPGVSPAPVDSGGNSGGGSFDVLGLLALAAGVTALRRPS